MPGDSYKKAKPLKQVDRTFVEYEGRRLAYFGGCDYFRLSTHPEVKNALRAGLEQHGLNVSASRVTTGNHTLYETLERNLASFFGVESALLVSSGYVANLAVAEAIDVTKAFVHKRSHSSVHTAVRLLNVKAESFQGAAVPNARRLKRPLIATDGLFAQDGELGRLDEYVRMLPPEGLLLVDDAHGAGTLGATGKGTPEVFGIKSKQLVQTITLSKAFGVFGGAILGARELCDRVVSRSRLFIGQTPLPLPLAAAALKSLELLRTDKSLKVRLNQRTAYVKSRLLALGFAIPDNPSPIAAFAPKERQLGALFCRALLKRGVFPSWIRYPGGPQHGYFRFAISSEHSPQQLEALLEAFMQLRPIPGARKIQRRSGAD